MGNRYGRKKTLRAKRAASSGERKNGNGSIVCKRGNEAIDKSVCEVYQIRNASLCYGCLHYRG
jgi:hypothetical protein